MGKRHANCRPVQVGTMCLFICGLFVADAAAQERADTEKSAAAAMSSLLGNFVEDGRIVGAELAVGRGGTPILERVFGRRSIDGEPVDAETLFCIGSCSKPFTSACVMTLISDGSLELDATIDRWLPAFAEPSIQGRGPARRPPTMRELLCHRGGIYSQMGRITRHQTRLIRDFSLTLEEATREIAKEELIAAPGERFAYSGAGYCVVGRVVEVATSQAIDDVLRHRIWRPLGMERTTYFPQRTDENVAVGFVRTPAGQGTNPLAPHLYGNEHRFALVGGSIYSTAREAARFAEMVAHRGRYQSRQVLSSEAWNLWTRRQLDDQPYGLGWRLTLPNGSDQAARVGHSGALASYRAAIDIDLESGRYCVAVWTLPRPLTREERVVGPALARAVNQFFRLPTD